jgi:pimeloyl-ACP methyl ester carboxylesterase
MSVRTVAGVNVQITGSGPRTVVLLHGFSDNLHTWHRVVPALAVRHRVIAIDLPGHGATTRKWTLPLLTGYVGVIAEILDDLVGEGVIGDERVSIIGNSMGAATAALVASQLPERVERVVLIGMPGLGSVPLLWRAATSRPAAVAIRTALSPVPITRLQRSFGWVYAHAASPRAYRIDPHTITDYGSSYSDRERFNDLPRLARALLADLRVVQLDRLLAELEVPALQVWGKHDRLVPSRHAHNQINAVVLAGCGHCPQLDSPDRLLDAIMPFLDGASVPRGEVSARLGGQTRAARS